LHKGEFLMASVRDFEPEAPVDGDPMVGQLALEWLDRDSMPRLFCTHDLALLWVNEAGRAQLMGGGDLELREGFVQACDRAGQLALARFAAECGLLLASLALPRGDGDGHLLIRARLVGDEDGRRCIGMSFHRTGSHFRPVYADLNTVFQLTPAEYRVLGEMIDGHTADAIAAATRLSIETVRSHIRHIYAKLHVSSRESLFKRIRPYRL
jgi:DNA-binding CsgD family transcriptional regulator